MSCATHRLDGGDDLEIVIRDAAGTLLTGRGEKS